MKDKCINWNGRVDKGGYGSISIGGKLYLPHRISYQLFNGRLTNTRFRWAKAIDHICNNKLCINPLHLQQITPKENVYRSNGLAVINAKKTHCPKGHPYSGSNLISKKSGRTCRTCRNEQRKNYPKYN